MSHEVEWLGPTEPKPDAGLLRCPYCRRTLSDYPADPTEIAPHCDSCSQCGECFRGETSLSPTNPERMAATLAQLAAD